VPGRASGVKMVEMVEVGAPISLDGVAVHQDCWCICLCYLHFAPENPEDGEMYLLVLAHPGCPGHGPESHKMVVVVVVDLLHIERPQQINLMEYMSLITSPTVHVVACSRRYVPVSVEPAVTLWRAL